MVINTRCDAVVHFCSYLEGALSLLLLLGFIYIPSEVLGRAVDKQFGLYIFVLKEYHDPASFWRPYFGEFLEVPFGGVKYVIGRPC